MERRLIPAQARRLPLWPWLAGAFCAAAGLAVAALAFFGDAAAGTRLALQVTARFSFLLFWPAYAGGALAVLFGNRFVPLKRHGRELGLAFASAQLVHLALVGWLCRLGAAPPLHVFVFFGFAVFWLYLIALLSAGDGPRWLPGWARRGIFFVGLNYIAYAFAVDFFVAPLQGGFARVLFYLPFAVLSVAGPALRGAAFLRRAGQGGAHGGRRMAA